MPLHTVTRNSLDVEVIHLRLHVYLPLGRLIEGPRSVTANPCKPIFQDPEELVEPGLLEAIVLSVVLLRSGRFLDVLDVLSHVEQIFQHTPHWGLVPNSEVGGEHIIINQR
jgi:hypothetical protein